MKKAYYGSRISENITKTPEGFLVCHNVPIARTGTQKYLGCEIGINDRQDKMFKVYREDEDVFNPKVLASFEGKPFTEEHPDDWVNPNNASMVTKGHASNVRRGTGKDSDLLLADIIVYTADEIEEIESKRKRDISCGYECKYEPYRDGYKQKNIVGNHIALVSAGRAGDRVAIKDNAVIQLKEGGQKRMSYKLPRGAKVSDAIKAIGLKTLAQDAEPDELLDVMDELVGEKYQSEKDAEPVIIEKEVEKIDNSAIDAMQSQISAVKDTIMSMLARMRDEDVEELEESNALDALDELEEELEKNPSEFDETEEVESIEKEAEELNEGDYPDEMNEEITKINDSMLSFVRAIKPVIANSNMNAKDKKKAADSLVNITRNLRDTVAKSSGKTSGNYSKIASRTKDSYEEAVDVGMDIAKKFNPHYKENGGK